MRGGGRTGPDARLVEAARDGARDALDALVADSLPLVYNVVGRALDGRPDVDDVVQETLLRVVRHLGELRDPGAFRPWVVAITVREIRRFEQQRRATLTLRTDPDLAADVPDPGSDFAALAVLRLGLTDQRREVAEATRWLDPDDRELVALWWLEEAGELDRGDLVEAMGVPGPHLAVRIQRMKQQLQIARTVVRALRAAPGCPELDSLLGRWDGVPGPLWRKRLARHVRDCARCRSTADDLVPVDRLLAGMPLVPAPAHLIAPSKPTARTTPHPRVRALPLAAGGAAVAAAVILTMYLVAPHRTPKPAAAPTPLPTAPVASGLIPSPNPAPSLPPSRSLSPPPGPSAAAVPPGTSATPAKKGVSVWTFTGVSQALRESGANWYYTWSTRHNGITTPPGVGFVPMIWGAASVTPDSLAEAKAAGPYLLGFNEPDMGSQANMSVEQALDMWPSLMAAGPVLGSPAVATGADKPGGWLDRFMSGAATRGYRVDFITLHWYGGDFVTDRAVSQLRAYLQAVYNRYHKPIWLTEYALIDFSTGTARYPTQDQQAAFVTASVKTLQGLSYVQRYAWFALPASDTAPTGLFRGGPQVTTVGRAFEAAG
jgi:RNA polymerase sigma factor (sigma-70 family)